jgi:hypothetical protein
VTEQGTSMGLFKHDGGRRNLLAGVEQRQADMLDKRDRASAAKRGIAIDDALFVWHGVNSIGDSFHTLVIRPDRVEMHNHATLGSILKQGRGVESMPIASIISVDARNEGLFGELHLQTAAGSIRARMNQVQAERARQVIAELMSSPSAPRLSDAAPASLSPVDRLKQLAEIRDSGILTDAEFEAKKAEILGRM